jgi:excisionase family DNA binding protein
MVRKSAAVKADEFNSLPVASAARYVGVSRQTMYTWIDERKVRTHKVAGFAAPRLLIADLERIKRGRID